MGNDVNQASGYFVVTISIHVPAWGTTEFIKNSLRQIGISIHVPAWGTTMAAAPLEMDNKISIHVPAWGTTVFNS